MITQLATQVELASQTIDYTTDLSALTIGLMTLVSLSAGMIVLTVLRSRLAPVFRLAIAIRRIHRVQGHAA